MKAVLFDVDGVLLDSFESNFKFYCDLMIRLGKKPPAKKEFTKLFHLSMMATVKALLPEGSKEDLEEAYRLVKFREVKYPVELLSLPKHAEDVLVKLGKHYALGIVSSRVRKNIFEFEALAKLEQHFKVIVSYEDTEKHKPDPQPLLFAAEKLGLHPKDIVYVGDAETDLRAAKAAGMKIVMFSKNAFDEADACTADFEEIPKIVGKL